MYPVNQVILGGESMFNNLDDIDMQIQRMEAYRQKLKQLRESQQQPQTVCTVKNTLILLTKSL